MKKIPPTICLEHNRPYELYCQTDDSPLCPLCINRHKGHQVIHTSTILPENELTQHLERIDEYRIKLQETYKGILKDCQRIQGFRQDLRKNVMDLLDIIYDELMSNKYYDTLEDRLNQLKKDTIKEFGTLTRKKREIKDLLENLRISIEKEDYARILKIRRDFYNSPDLHENVVGYEKDELSKCINSIPQGPVLKEMTKLIQEIFRDFNNEKGLYLYPLLRDKHKFNVAVPAEDKELLLQLKDVKEKDEHTCIEEAKQIKLGLQAVLIFLQTEQELEKVVEERNIQATVQMFKEQYRIC
eukprot:TRINITY_DN108848_c0_g1_i1.p1 TRINITY_DN108848_c0_g1~~TRINITY_DN108848_c0_g1_i1.p1  ORF type:complete len:336 (-),score=20.20 TRINITY_DN108848_c0_g1_i1:704-1600(-)